MPASNERTHRMVPLPGPGWTKAVVAGVVVLVAVTVLTVSVMASGDDAGPATEPKADQHSGETTREPEGQGGVEEKESKSAKPSKDKDKDKDDEDSGGGDGGDSGGSSSSYPGSGTYEIKSGGLCLGVGPEPGNPDRPEVFVFDSCGSASPPTKLAKTGSREYQLTVYDPGKGTGCMQVDSPGDGPGLLAAPTSCSGSDLQTFTLKRVSGGYRMTVGSGVCLGPLHGGASAGEALATRSCDGAVLSIG